MVVRGIAESVTITLLHEVEDGPQFTNNPGSTSN